VRVLSFDKDKDLVWGCVVALDVSNKAVLYSLTITDTNWMPQASLNDPVRVVISFAYLPHHKPISCKLKRATRTPYNLWGCNRILSCQL